MSILVLRHWDSNDLGHLAPVLDELGLPYEYFDAHKATGFPDPQQYRGIVSLGAYYNVDDVAEFPSLPGEKRFIKNAVEKEIPFFGICFGSQLLANAFGARVNRDTWVEKGWVNIALTDAGKKDALLKSFAPALTQFHWHNDSFELPEEATLLASSEACPNQILRVGEKAYGVQFHPEVVPTVIEEWMTMSKTMTDERKAAIRTETAARYETSKREGQDLFRRFWQRFS